MSTQSPESASTPISHGGYRYNPADPQDVIDFENFGADELQALERDRGYDFSEHPARQAAATPELSPEDAELLVTALTDYEPALRAALAGPSPGPGAAGRLVEALELARRLRSDMLAAQD